MDLLDFYSFVRPVLIATEGEYSSEYPYYFGGSCFITSIGLEYYVFTARHNVDAYSPNFENLRILASHTHNVFLPLLNKYHGQDKRTNGDPTVGDFTDVVMFTTTLPLFAIEYLKDITAYPLDPPKDKAGTISTGTPLQVLGYPLDHQRIDYEAKHIHHNAMHLEGIYQEGENDFRHVMTITKFKDLMSVNGFCGSPVLKLVDNSWKLAGMVLTGSLSSKILRYIDAGMMRYMIYQAREFFNQQIMHRASESCSPTQVEMITIFLSDFFWKIPHPTLVQGGQFNFVLRHLDNEVRVIPKRTTLLFEGSKSMFPATTILSTSDPEEALQWLASS